MRDNSYDRTIERNYLQKWRFLIPEYEAVKAGRSKVFKRVGDFYAITEPARRRSASITTAICRAGMRQICCRAAADQSGGNGAKRRASWQRSLHAGRGA